MVLGGLAYLDNLPVESRADLELLGVGDDSGRDESRAKGGPVVETFADAPLPPTARDLPLPLRNVVADGIAEHVVQRLRFRHVAALPPDHDH